jgi:Uncharacterised nucleotidyltransferase
MSFTTSASPQLAPHHLLEPRSRYTEKFSPELDLILACCNQKSDEEASARIQQILPQTIDGQAIDEQKLVQLAQKHGLMPQVHRRLSVEMDARQSICLEALRHEDKVNTHRALWLTLELLNIQRHLAARGLEILPYKGPVLAQALYGNVALRQFTDLDILVHPRDLPGIKVALAVLGYSPGLSLSPAAQRDHLKSGYEYTFDGARGRNLLEIKWQILPAFYSVNFDIDNFFARAGSVVLEGQKLRTLCDQDLMLVLCVHAAKHAWKQISWLCDIVQLARSRSVDWALLKSEAERVGIARIVVVTFLLAQKLLGAELPPEIGSLRNETTEALANSILPTIVAEEEWDTESTRYFRLMTKLRERQRDRLSFWWRLLVTPGAGEWSTVRLPDPLFPLYRVVRFCRLAGRLIAARI